jgi:thymidine phosphorylase
MIDPIAKTFGVIPMPENNNEQEFTKQAGVRSDFEFARENLLKIIGNGSEAIESVTVLADMSQNPRFFEVLATFMSTMVTANKELLTLQKSIRDIEQMEHNDKQEITNNLFVGSSTELLKLLKEVDNKK